MLYCPLFPQIWGIIAPSPAISISKILQNASQMSATHIPNPLIPIYFSFNVQISLPTCWGRVVFIRKSWWLLGTPWFPCLLSAYLMPWKWPCRPPGQYRMNTRPMMASSGFAWSPGPPPSGDVSGIVLAHQLSHRNTSDWGAFFRCRLFCHQPNCSSLT